MRVSYIYINNFISGYEYILTIIVVALLASSSLEQYWTESTSYNILKWSNAIGHEQCRSEDL